MIMHGFTRSPGESLYGECSQYIGWIDVTVYSMVMMSYCAKLTGEDNDKEKKNTICLKTFKICHVI